MLWADMWFPQNLYVEVLISDTSGGNGTGDELFQEEMELKQGL